MVRLALGAKSSSGGRSLLRHFNLMFALAQDQDQEWSDDRCKLATFDELPPRNRAAGHACMRILPDPVASAFTAIGKRPKARGEGGKSPSETENPICATDSIRS